MCKAIVYRIQDVPLQCSEDELSQLLVGQLKEDEQGILQQLDIRPCCQKDAEGKVALAKFSRPPSFLNSLADDSYFSLSISNQERIKFDKHFFGFTQLSTATDEAQEITADIIAITGIGGHAYGSWRDSKADFMWIHDALPAKLPRCRIMLYGYDSKIDVRSTSRLRDYCIKLRRRLDATRGTDQQHKRPIFFLAHSFGGIITANTLVQAHTDNDRGLYNAIEAVLFFGTPHKGLVVADIRSMLGDIDNPRHKLLDQIDAEKEFLGDQLDSFKNIIGDREIVSFYETRQSRMIEIREGGVPTRTGPYHNLANRDDLLLGFPDSQEQKIPVDSDHSRMVKFESRSNETYLETLKCLQKFEQSAQAKVLQRCDPAYNPKKLMKWLSSVDFRAREGEKFNSGDVVELGDVLLKLEEFQLWRSGRIKRLHVYGAPGSGKTYLAFFAAKDLERLIANDLQACTSRSLADQTSRSKCVVSLYFEPGDEGMSKGIVLGAILKQLIQRRHERPISTTLQLHHMEASATGQQLQAGKASELVEREILNYGYVYLIVDGLHNISEKVRNELQSFITMLSQSYEDRFGTLYMQREDGTNPDVVYCDECTNVIPIHFRCRECTEAKDMPYDLCTECEKRLDHDQSHSLSLFPEAITWLPPRLKDMKIFIERLIDQHLDHCGISQDNSRLSCQTSQVVSSILAKQCLEKPELKARIASSISHQLYGESFREARARFESLESHYTLSAFQNAYEDNDWKDGTSYLEGLDLLMDDSDQTATRYGKHIVNLALASRRPLIVEELRTAMAVFAEDSTDEDSKIGEPRMIMLAKGLVSVLRDTTNEVLVDVALKDLLRQSQKYDRIRLQAHSTMATTCLKYLNMPELVKTCRFENDDQFLEMTFLPYVALFWGEHLHRVGFDGNVDASKSEIVAQMEKEALRFLKDRERLEAFINGAWTLGLPKQCPLPWDVNSGIGPVHVCAWFGLTLLIPKIPAEYPIDEPEPTYQQTPLMYACRKGHQSFVDELLDSGVDPHHFSSKGYNALFEAVTVVSGPETTRSKVDIIRRLVKGKKVNIEAVHKSSKRRTALHIATTGGNSTIVKELLEEYSAVSNHVDRTGYTPLMHATFRGKFEEVEMLLNNKADTDLFGDAWRFRTTALHIAVENDYSNIALLLLEHGADSSAEDVWGLDVEAKAVKQELGDVVQRIREIRERSPDKRAPLRVEEVHPMPPKHFKLHHAVARGNVDRVREIMRQTPFLARTVDESGRTPLHLAANSFNQHLGFMEEYGDERCEPIRATVELLAPYSGLHMIDKWGLTPMDYAVYNLNVHAQVELLEAGAIYEERPSDDVNCLLGLAFQAGKRKAMQKLFDSGADELTASSFVVRGRLPQGLGKGKVLEELKKCRQQATKRPDSNSNLPMQHFDPTPCEPLGAPSWMWRWNVIAILMSVLFAILVGHTRLFDALNFQAV